MNFAGQIRFLPVSFVCSFFFFSRGFTSGPSIARLSRTLAASLCLTSQKEWFAEKMRLYVSIRPGGQACSLLAQSRHRPVHCTCLLLGVKEMLVCRANV